LAGGLLLHVCLLRLQLPSALAALVGLRDHMGNRGLQVLLAERANLDVTLKHLVEAPELAVVFIVDVLELLQALEARVAVNLVLV
jgi:hypothetical protein